MSQFCAPNAIMFAHLFDFLLSNIQLDVNLASFICELFKFINLFEVQQLPEENMFEISENGVE